VWVVPGPQHPALYTSSIVTSLQDFNWISGAPPPPLTLAATQAVQRALTDAEGARAGEALAAWLALEAPSPPPFATLPVAFKDRHRTGDTPRGDVTVVRRCELRCAAALLCERSPLPANATVGLSDGTRVTFTPNWHRVAHEEGGAATARDDDGDATLLVLLRCRAPHFGVAPGQVLVLFSAEDPPSVQRQGSPGAADAPVEGRLVYGGGAILCGGPSLWEQDKNVGIAH
jgi:hypothetical protein